MKRLFCALLLMWGTGAPALAQMSDDAVRIGVMTDLSSWGRDNPALLERCPTTKSDGRTRERQNRSPRP